jgi:beta-1,4-mannosyl-glycoprotein beta-1,4-N-acetylglucosaminyltransferase
MKIYNTFPFFNELDLLEIRLNELYDVVDYFVIIEGERTHQNEPKPLYYQENKERYAKFQDKIIHLVLSEENFNDDSYYNEIISFDAFTHALDATDAQDDDIVIIECADEITKAEVVVELAKSYTQPCFIEAHNFCYYLNARFEEGGEYWWTGPIISVGHMKQFDRKTRRCWEWGRNPQNCAPSSTLIDIPLPHAWHFTFMGGKEDVLAKATSYVHTEFNHFTEEDYQASIDNLQDPFKRTGAMSHKFVEMYPLEKLPKYVQDNIEKFSHLIKK